MEANLPIEIVRAEISDARAIAEVNVAAWKTTYRGIFDDAFLDNMSVSDRELKWNKLLARNEQYSCWVAKQGNAIIGFADAGKSRTNSDNFDTELYAIYILKEHSRRGIGTLLVKQILADSHRLGYRSMIVWVVKDNESKHFYAVLGAVLLPITKIEKIGERNVELIAYGWRNLDSLNL